MKTLTITYWVTTAIVGLMMIYSAYAYFTEVSIQQAFQHLGYPDYFRIKLGIAKVVGAVLLLAPVGARLKEWVYAGFTFTFVSALIAHTVAGDPVSARMAPVIFLLLLAVSYVTFHKRHAVQHTASVG